MDEKAVIPIAREANRLITRYGLDKDKFYVTYCGNIGLTQNMDMLLEVAKELKSYNDIMFILIGEGVYKNELTKKLPTTDWTISKFSLSNRMKTFLMSSV